MRTKIIPALVEYYGTRPNPWDANATDRNELLDQVKDILKKAVPRREHDSLNRADIIYLYVSAS